MHVQDHYTENEARDCIIQVTKAILYCHQNEIVHRDLKPENLLYSDFDEEKAVLKLADFGLAKVSCDSKPWYRAPDLRSCLSMKLEAFGIFTGRRTLPLTGGGVTFVARTMACLSEFLNIPNVGFVG